MTQLHGLDLDDCQCKRPAELQPCLVQAVLKLQCLTQLMLYGQGMHAAPTSACEAQQLHGAWPELQHLSLELDYLLRGVEQQAVVRAVCGLPALQKLVVLCGSSDSSERVSSRVACVDSATGPASPQDIAAAAGVVVTTHELSKSMLRIL